MMNQDKTQYNQGINRGTPLNILWTQQAYPRTTLSNTDLSLYEMTELRKLLSIFTLPRKDGDVLQYKDGQYRWVPITQAFTIYSQTLK